MARATRVLGIDLGATQIEKLVAGMGFAYTCEGEGAQMTLTVTPPSYRYDIAIEEDLIEEIARLHGYDNIPAPPPKARLEMMPLPETSRRPMLVRRLVAERGYHEVVNYSFVEAAWEADFSGNDTPVRLANPIASQMGVMRSSLIGSLVGTLLDNLKRQTERVRVFEVGRCFLQDATTDTGFRQPVRLAALASGPAQPEQWGLPAKATDFYDVKGDLEALFAPRTLAFERIVHPALHPGRSARVLLDGQPIGVIGEIHPRWKQKYELGNPAVVFEIDFDPLLTPQMPLYREVSRFPAVIRDIALVAPHHCEVQALLDALKSSAPAYLREIWLFDVYQGKGVAPESKSLAFRVVLQDTQKTLADNDADAAVARLVQTASEQFGAVLRG
jgi:phenylalanyl-tRNA synthetase beta chain